MQLWISHLTRYKYSADVSEAHMELRLRPANGGGQRVHAYHLDVRPQTTVRGYVDGFGNHVQYFNVLPPHAALQVVSRAQVETGQPPGSEPLDLVPTDLLLFRAPVLDTAGVRRLARRTRLRDPGSREQVLEALDRIVGTIARALTYTTDVTTVSTDVEEVLRLGHGVCQDFAHLFIAVARAVGVPCRYASGYVYAGAGEPFVGASHAWAEAWVPDRGWTAYDSTHPGLSPEHYVRLAVGRDYRDAAPTRGVFVGSAESVMEARVEIRTADTGTA
jgi:transglutaminase-like putative cysteine protease